MRGLRGLREQDEGGEGFEMPSNMQTRQRREHQESDPFLRDPDLTCIPSHPTPQDEVPASVFTQTLAHLPEATGLGRKTPRP